MGRCASIAEDADYAQLAPLVDSATIYPNEQAPETRKLVVVRDFIDAAIGATHERIPYSLGKRRA